MVLQKLSISDGNEKAIILFKITKYIGLRKI